MIIRKTTRAMIRAGAIGETLMNVQVRRVPACSKRVLGLGATRTRILKINKSRIRIQAIVSQQAAVGAEPACQMSLAGAGRADATKQMIMTHSDHC